ncbi:hypothetical protein [Streptomyces durbertensis]|uniref:hypothetical protein n=1 Tax=Streptomyces durbertensis TaxID=2448886 RepID=UPI003F69DBC9
MPPGTDIPFERNGWSNLYWPVLPAIFLPGLISAGLTVGSRFLPENTQFLGLKLTQWGVALAVFATWSAVWTLTRKFGSVIDNLNVGAGQWIALLALFLLTGATIAGSYVPALRVPLISGSGTNAGLTPYGQPQQGQPGQPHLGQPQPGGYGYPGAHQPGQPQPGQQQPGQPQPGQQQPGGYGYPAPQQQGQPSYGGPQQGGPQQGGQAQPAQHQQPAQPQPQATAPDPNFQPFWFAVPAARPLFGEDGSPNPIAELAPGTWYLAVEQRGQALIAQTQDGRRGVLQDTSGIQRG